MAQVLALLDSGEATAVEVAEATLSAIEARDAEVGAYLTVNRAEALEQAVARFALKQYLASPVYRGTRPAAAGPDENLSE